jgi:hypothetical protein
MAPVAGDALFHLATLRHLKVWASIEVISRGHMAVTTDVHHLWNTGRGRTVASVTIATGWEPQLDSGQETLTMNTVGVVLKNSRRKSVAHHELRIAMARRTRMGDVASIHFGSGIVTVVDQV